MDDEILLSLSLNTCIIHKLLLSKYWGKINVVKMVSFYFPSFKIYYQSLKAFDTCVESSKKDVASREKTYRTLSLKKEKKSNMQNNWAFTNCIHIMS